MTKKITKSRSDSSAGSPTHAKRSVSSASSRRGAHSRAVAQFERARAAIDQTHVAGIVFAETSVLSGDATSLASARRFIAGVAFKRDGSGVAPPNIPSDDDLTNPITKEIWSRCQTAAADASGDDVGNCDHFVIWFSDDDGATPSKSPSRIPDDWPYDQTDKVSGAWGPFKSPIKPKGKNIFVIKYCGVP